MAKPKLKLVVDPQVGEHVKILVFAGPDRDHLASNGRLMFRPDEAEVFIGLMADYSLGLPDDDVVVERCGLEAMPVELRANAYQLVDCGMFGEKVLCATCRYEHYGSRQVLMVIGFGPGITCHECGV